VAPPFRTTRHHIPLRREFAEPVHSSGWIRTTDLTIMSGAL
jgi:hypothetical protein